MSATRMVMVCPLVPEVMPQHAGGRLVRDVVTALDPAVHLSVIVPTGPSVEQARPHPRIDQVVVIGPGAGGHASPLDRRIATYLRTGVAARWFVRGLVESEAATRAVAAADVVDLQWQEQAALVAWVRGVNPRARVTVVLHDVLSQAAERSRAAVPGSSARSQLLRWRWSWARTRARAIEARLTGAEPGEATPDAVAVLSVKDARLLPGGSVPVVVVPPPLGQAHRHVTRVPAAAPKELLMVAFMARWDNEDALQWFVTRVLPIVRRSHPDIRLRVAGGGIRSSVTDLAHEHGVELLGFVPDLDPLYRTANAVIVPLRLGAGLKFKVVEALSAGVPVVTTPVGAEGVGPSRWFAEVTGDPDRFAAALITVLDEHDTAEARAGAARDEVALAYGEHPFRQALARLYGVGVVEASGARPAGSTDVPRVSVVIPAHNAADTIGQQLAALAHQIEAPPFEVVVADNRSTDGTARTAGEWAASIPCGLRVVPAHARSGAGHARNVGIHEARGQAILLCDADDRVSPGWVASMSRALRDHAIVGSDVIPFRDDEAHPRQSARRAVPGASGDIAYVLSCSMAVRRDLWERIGGFDEAYRAGHEEVDLCCRAQSAGWSIGYVHDAVVEYRLRSGRRDLIGQGFGYAEGYVLLWTRFHDSIITAPVSVKGAVRHAVALTLRAWHPASRENPADQAHALGWAWGIVAGHLRYRVLGKPPAPRLWPAATR